MERDSAVWVTLTPEDIALADRVGRWRRANAVKSKYRPGHKAPVEPEAALELDIRGARGEVAVLHWLSPILWHGENDTGFDSVGDKVPDFEVRGPRPIKIDAKTRRLARHKLLIQFDDDHPLWVYLLVCGAAHPRYSIRGWTLGREAMQPCFIDKPLDHRDGGYFIPEGHKIMRSPAALLRAVRQRQFVGRDSAGRFLHYCWCGEWGAHGYNSFLGQPGEWYCGEHKP